MQVIRTITGAVAFSALAFAAVGVANAADDIEARMAPNPMSGNISVWGAGVIPTGYDQQANQECDGFFPSNFCEGDFGFGSDARVYYEFDNGYGFQLESLFDYHLELDDNDSDDDEHSFHAAVAGHLIRRSGAMAYGAFFGLSGTGHLDQRDRSVHGIAGLEAAMMRGNNTFFGQVGYAGAIAGDDQVDHLLFGRAGARHFFDPNKRLEGSVAGGFTNTAEKGDPENLTWVQVAANYEQKFDDNPFSWFVGYQGDYLDVHQGFCCDESVWVHTILAGFRMTFGATDTLQMQDNYGARTFDLTNLRAPLSYPDEL